MSAGADLRAEAAGMLTAVIHQGQSLKAVLAATLPAWPDPRDRALLEAICFSALRHRRRYEAALSQWLQRPLPARDREVQALLLAGLAQIDALGLPAHAAVSTSAEAAKLLDREALVGLVNAVLRRAQREGLPRSEDIAIESSHPDWLVRTLQGDWPDDVENLLRENNHPAPLWLRANAPRQTRASLLAALAEAEVTATAPAFPADAVCIEARVAPTRLPGWREGVFAVQDAAAQLAVTALSPQPGERVLDACAAPGGKTAQLAAALGEGELLALEIDAERLQKVADTLQRLGLASPRVQLQVGDAGDSAAWWDGRPFDAILLDAPCSATGIIRRQPDIKWHRRADDIPALVAQQRRLLDALWPLLRPGGRLLYASCSVLKDENERQVEHFLAATPSMRALPLDERFGRASGAGRQRLPGEDGMDGFYYALLARDA